MNTSDETETSRKSYRYQHKLAGSLNLFYNVENSMLCLWNKYQIFIHETLNFTDTAKIIIPEFQIKSCFLIHNYLICLDYSNGLHTMSLKFKHAVTKRLKSNFILRDQNILKTQIVDTNVLSIKLENSTYFICTYQIDADFHILSKRKILKCDTIYKEINVLYAYPLTDSNTIIEAFNFKEVAQNNQYLILIMFDTKTLHGCMFNDVLNNDIELKKIYTCPADVSDLQILNNDSFQIVISLSIGTLIKFTITPQKTYEIIHMNTCIEKFLEINNNIIYTDGNTMWKTENILGSTKFKQLYVKHPKDFIKCGDQIICTTYSNFIYILSIDDESSYLKPISNEEYCSANNLVNHTYYLSQISEELKKVEELLSKLMEEKNYVTTLALSSKQHLLDTIIRYHVNTFDNYENMIKDDMILTFTDDLYDIFSKDTFYFLVQIKTSLKQHNFKGILSHLFGDLRIHITLLTNNKIIKTTTINVLNELKKLNLVVTLQSKHIDLNKNFYVNIKLVKRIPGVLDEKQYLWICIHEKQIQLKSEYFIKTCKTTKNVYMKSNNSDIQNVLLKFAQHHYGALFDINRSLSQSGKKKWTFYLNLPLDYNNKFDSESYSETVLGKDKSIHIREMLTREEFLNSQSTMYLSIGNERTEIEFINDGFSKPILKVSCMNMKVALDIRNFIHCMIEKNFNDEEILVNMSMYDIVMALKEAAKDIIEGDRHEDVFDLHHDFQRNILANIPL